MSVHLVWIEGNKYAAWLVSETQGIHVFLGYHFVLSHLTLEQIHHNLMEGLTKAFNVVRDAQITG